VAAEAAEVVAVVVAAKDRFGLGWRPELSASILLNGGEIDIIEIVAENFLKDKKVSNSLKTLAAQIPITIHAVSLGLASSLPVEIHRLEKLAKLFDVITPSFWSEHLAFVRAGGYEIGHLAAPPRNNETVEGTIRNIELATKIIGLPPLMENIATLMNPPTSDMSESEWISAIVSKTSAGLLLDLHNLYANSINFNFNAKDFLLSLPLNKIAAVHLSGGKWVKNPKTDKMYLLDDHLHDVPEEVYGLLEFLASICPNALSVIIERDGKYPLFDSMLSELRKARQAVATGRELQVQAFEESNYACG